MTEPLRKVAKEEVKKEILSIKPEIETILLDDISRDIRRLLKHAEETTPEGVDVPLETTTVTSIKPEIIDVAHVPLRSIYLSNKGPNSVFYRINDDPTELELESGESIKVERPRRTIVRVTLRTNTGESATVRKNGQY